MGADELEVELDGSGAVTLQLDDGLGDHRGPSILARVEKELVFPTHERLEELSIGGALKEARRRGVRGSTRTENRGLAIYGPVLHAQM